MINFNSAAFMLSVARIADLPQDVGSEVAFAGRSNAGKSSALNLITARNGLARVSKTPGRTQLLNFFALSPEARLVDLPGYGFAQVPMEVREKWAQLIESYLVRRCSLKGLVILMDIRHPMTPLDRQVLNLCLREGFACHILLTKADKLGRGAAGAALNFVRKEVAHMPLVSVQLFSSTTRLGLDEARQRLTVWLEGHTDAVVSDQ